MNHTDPDLLEDFKRLITEVGRRVISETVDPAITATTKSLTQTAINMSRNLGQQGKEAAETLATEIDRLKTDAATFRKSLQEILECSNAVEMGKELHNHVQALKDVIPHLETSIAEIAKGVNSYSQEIHNLRKANELIASNNAQLESKFAQFASRIGDLEGSYWKHSENNTKGLTHVKHSISQIENIIVAWKTDVTSNLSIIHAQVETWNEEKKADRERERSDFMEVHKKLTVGMTIMVFMFIILAITILVK